MKKIPISLGIAVSVLLFSFVASKNDGVEANKIHKKVITLDSHIDIRDDFNTANNDVGKEILDQIDLPKFGEVIS